MAKGGDSDGDGMPNRWETKHGLNDHKANGGKDADTDGLTNIGEFKNDSDPKDEDTDDDGSDDGDEVKVFDTEPDDDDTDNDGVEDGDDDADEDGVDNEDEDDADEKCKADDDDADEDGVDDEDENDFGTDPDDADTDDDGVDDGDEDADQDGVEDDDQDDDPEDECSEVLGVIASFDSTTGLLTVKTPSGATIAGTVTEDTELEWDSSGHGSGDCPDDDEASTVDLTPGIEVSEMDFDDDSGALEEVELICPL